MASNDEILKSFLVSVGFQVDDNAFRRFVGGLAQADSKAMLVGKTVAAVAVAAEAMVQVFSHQMEKLYYASQRTKASVGNIQALEYGAEQVGVAGETARRSLEGMAAAVRMNPGLRGLMDRIVGKPTAGMDQAKAMMAMVQNLGKMPHMVGARFAGMFGMDEETFTMLVQKGPEMERAMALRNKLLAESGINAEQAAAAGREYMNTLREIWERVTILGDAVSVKLLPSFREFVQWTKHAMVSVEGFKRSAELGGFIKQLDDIAVELGKVDRQWNVIGHSTEWVSNLVSAGVDVLMLLTSAALNAGAAVAAFFAGDWKTWANKSHEFWLDLHDVKRQQAKRKGETTPEGSPMPPGGGTASVEEGTSGAMSRDEKLAYLAHLEKIKGLPGGILARMWYEESREGARTYNSKSGAAGDFQFMPKTAAEFGLTGASVYDFAASATAAAAKMQGLMRWANGDATKAAMGYNWGEGNMEKYRLGQASLPRETANYGQAVGGGTGVTIQQTNHINVSGGGSPTATGQAVAGAMRQPNSELVRNMVGAVR